MDEQKRARLATLQQRQLRSRRTLATLEAWRSRGASATALSHERSEQLVGWLRANWRQPDQLVEAPDRLLQCLTENLDAVVALDFWQWDEAVAVLVPTGSLLRLTSRLREVYPDGFLVADQSLTKALLVDFDEDAEGVKIAQIGAAF